MRPGRGPRFSAAALGAERCVIFGTGEGSLVRGRGTERARPLAGAGGGSPEAPRSGVSPGGRKVPKTLVQLPVVNWAEGLGTLAPRSMALRGSVVRHGAARCGVAQRGAARQSVARRAP